MNLSRFKWLIGPLASRKVRVALATVIAAFLSQFIPKVNEEFVLTVLGVGVALILGIAAEDAGLNIAGKTKVQQAIEQENLERHVPKP